MSLRCSKETVDEIFNVLESEVELTEEEIEQICKMGLGQSVLEYGRGRLAKEIKKSSKEATKKLCRELREDEKVAIVAKVIQDEKKRRANEK